MCVYGEWGQHACFSYFTENMAKLRLDLCLWNRAFMSIVPLVLNMSYRTAITSFVQGVIGFCHVAVININTINKLQLR